MSGRSAGKRIAYIDFLKAFAIATVLLGHSVEQLSGDAFWDHPIWAFLYSVWGSFVEIARSPLSGIVAGWAFSRLWFFWRCCLFGADV